LGRAEGTQSKNNSANGNEFREGEGHCDGGNPALVLGVIFDASDDDAVAKRGYVMGIFLRRSA
jgi:hypothetical protein